MADPQERRGQVTSAVASCTATDCRHNENRECHAGEIEVKMVDGGAVCGTYDSTSPKARP